MSNVTLTGSICLTVFFFIYCVCLFPFAKFFFFSFMLCYHIYWWNKVVYINIVFITFSPHAVDIVKCSWSNFFLFTTLQYWLFYITLHSITLHKLLASEWRGTRKWAWPGSCDPFLTYTPWNIGETAKARDLKFYGWIGQWVWSGSCDPFCTSWQEFSWYSVLMRVFLRQILLRHLSTREFYSRTLY